MKNENESMSYFSWSQHFPLKKLFKIYDMVFPYLRSQQLLNFGEMNYLGKLFIYNNYVNLDIYKN